jgi:hypothetical protein
MAVNAELEKYFAQALDLPARSEDAEWNGDVKKIPA